MEKSRIHNTALFFFLYQIFHCAGNLIPFPTSGLVVEGAVTGATQLMVEGGAGATQLMVEGGPQVQLLTAGQDIYQILTPEGAIQAHASTLNSTPWTK
jgi:hypothetical protein